MYKILVVDDSRMIVDVFVDMLDRCGYTTIPAFSGLEALDYLGKVKEMPDLILLDIMMEPIDGWETLERIRMQKNTRNVPIIMLTAKPLTPSEAQEYGIFIEDYLLKPTTHQQLKDAIESVLERESSIKKDVKNAMEAGIDQDLIDEYKRLNKSISVNKRLLNILETVYFPVEEDGIDDNISRAMKSMSMSIIYQEERLNEIKEQFRKMMN